MASTDQSTTARRFTVPCTISVKHTMETLEAHVELDNGVKPTLGDRIIVDGKSVAVPYGESITLRRNATVIRANALEKLWMKLKSRFELTELYEVSFTSGRL